ncbi:MAG: hypothetical protein RMJ33_12185 [Saprospiraceae bacterium]|nr:hypothetical protein [Saprospiraceae bacterium]MDW8230586.1 hypothetical protein [Saprospiraceae bacterium]
MKKPPKIEKYRGYSVQIFRGKSGAFSRTTGNCLEMLILDVEIQNKYLGRKRAQPRKPLVKALFFAHETRPPAQGKFTVLARHLDAP